MSRDPRISPRPGDSLTDAEGWTRKVVRIDGGIVTFELTKIFKGKTHTQRARKRVSCWQRWARSIPL